MVEMNPMAGLEAIKGIQGTIGIPETILVNPAAASPAKVDKVDFGQLMEVAMGAINKTQVEADAAIAKLAAGQDIELHSVMIAAEKASMTLQLALQIKNKITEAYQEVMRMQI